MKTKALKTILLAIFSLLFALPIFSQKGIEDGSKYGKGADSINCIKNLSLYKEFYKHGNYRDAINPWRHVFGECPASSEKMYVEGVSMYKNFLESDISEERKDEMVDTIMLIYDRRIEYFPDLKGSILGRKGVDLLRYRRSDLDDLNEAYGILKESIDLEKNKTRDVVFITYINTSIALNKSGAFDDNQVIDDYFMVTAIVDKLVGKSSRWKETKGSIDELMLNSGLLTCEALNDYFEPQFGANKTNRAFLEKVINFYTQTGCDRADLYVATSEQMYAIEPGPFSAHQLARLFMVKNDFEKATRYLKEAVQGSEVENDIRAEWNYELALVTRALENYCEAIVHAKQAIAQDSKLGKAYILLGDCYILSRESLGDDFEQRTAYWAAADKYSQARAVDPEVSEEATKKLNDYSTQYPARSEVFFRDMKDGDSYQVKGCINEYTTVRSVED
jgi:hypothetical protein